MARIDVLMPQMGESIAEGTVSKWLKKLGDPVKRDEPLFEISTDKVDAEIPAPAAGVLAEIKVQQGETVPVQTLVAVIETDAGAVAPSAAAAAPPSAAAQRAPAASASPAGPASAAPPSAAAQRAPAAAGGAPSAGPAPSAPVRRLPPPSDPAGKGGDGPETAEERLRKKSTPLVRKIAAEHQLDIATIPGTGFAGRVTKQDVLGFIESGAARTVARPGAPVPRPASPVPTPGPVEHPVVEPWPGDRVEPFSKIRKITADHMIMSRRVSAHVTSFFEVDYSKIAELRKRHKASYAERGVSLTYLAFIAKACAEQLRQHAVVNAAVSGDNIIYRRDVNIGIAVALDWGLIVPVVKHADEMSLLGLARTINDLGERARTKKLSPEEIQRGTFTITNPGVFGSFAGAPIINQPQVAILGVGAIEKRPKVVALPDGTDTIAIRTMGMLSMSYDHRVVDGADADRFLADVKALLQDFPEGAV
ncbi:MAG: 2-oxoglutarate dehydrogenase, E2 component, dihydrolipoamide succinyltransferase [Gemmatimonadetes bacterium]|nr:MAG: 2-oxoglutarate dehydrogenase, E2 component, dihydrolipoamide succinyltransferase [Gemmatimonadota bacterium]